MYWKSGISICKTGVSGPFKTFDEPVIWIRRMFPILGTFKARKTSNTNLGLLFNLLLTFLIKFLLSLYFSVNYSLNSFKKVLKI